MLSTDETVALWRHRNGCAETPKQVYKIDKSDDKTYVGVTEWSDCTGAPVKLFRVNNGGHTWPSGVQYLTPRIVGETSTDISASEAGWSFFSQF